MSIIEKAQVPEDDDPLHQLIVGRLQGVEESLMSSTTAAWTVNSPAKPVSSESLVESMARLERAMRTFGLAAGEASTRLDAFCDAAFPGMLFPWQRDMLHLLGMQVHESPQATQQVPRRVHKKRRNQTEAYHRRIQKKWAKRFGMKHVPAAFVMDASLLDIGAMFSSRPRQRREILVAHPSIAAELRSGGQ